MKVEMRIRIEEDLKIAQGEVIPDFKAAMKPIVHGADTKITEREPVRQLDSSVNLARNLDITQKFARTEMIQEMSTC